MKRISLLVALLSIMTTTFAALKGTGYYRILNKKTNRYITVASNRFFTQEEKDAIVAKKSTDIELKAMETIGEFSNVVSDPASIIYVRSGSETDGKTGYDFVSQGMDTYASFGRNSQYFPNPHIQIAQRNNGYQCRIGLSGVYQGFEFSGDLVLCDSETKQWDNQLKAYKGVLNTYDTANNGWDFIPFSQSDNAYFGVKPDVHVGDAWYGTFFASFAFTTQSSGMAVYIVDQITSGMAVLRELSGTIPANTPVIIKCSSSKPADNRINIVYSKNAAPSGNRLGGNYFEDQDYNATTMRILGVGADGNLAFVKKSISKLPANKAFLHMNAKEAAVANTDLRLISRADFEADPEITVTAADVTRHYGEMNPKFSFTIDGGIAKGVPELTCEATATSPVGTYPIVVSKGSITNSAVNYVHGTLTILEAPMTVTAKSYDRMVGDENPDFEATYNGFKNRETSSVFTKQPTFTCAATKDSPEGEYPIEVSGIESPNYQFTYYPGVLKVYPRRITAQDEEREYGNDNPTFTYYPPTVIQGDPEFTCTATNTSPAGTYDIIISQGTVKNEGVDFVKGTLTVTKAPIDISVGNYTKRQGEPNPAFEVVFNGLKFDEDAEKVKNSVTVTCEANESSAPGEYSIILSAVDNDCYYFRSITSGKLVIYQSEDVVVTANDVTREYGDPNPELTFRASGSTLEGTPTVSCEATTESPAGTYPIVVSKGSVTNEKCVFVNGTLTVTKAPVDVAVGTYSKKEGEENPAFELVFSGLKNSADADRLRASVSIVCEATASSSPGEYDIVLSGGDNDRYYFRKLTNGKLIVTEADFITVIARDYTREYGGPNPTFRYNVEGGTLDGEPAISCAADEKSPVGTYPIVLEKGSIRNPSGLLVNGVLTITQAPLTVTVEDCEREMGEENPVFTLVYEGWKNLEDESVLITKPVASTIASKWSTVGYYTISVSGGEAQNYYFIYKPGTLNVKEINGIEEIIAAAGGAVNVYSLSGQLVRAKATTLDGLKSGVYVVNGRKVVVK